MLELIAHYRMRSVATFAIISYDKQFIMYWNEKVNSL